MLLILFSAVLFFVQGVPDIQFDAKRFVVNLLSGSIAPEYWFLYAYISFLILLPYLRRVAQDFTERDFWYFLLIHFLWSTLRPIVNYIFVLNGQDGLILSASLKFPLMVENLIFYPIIGYYLDQKVDIGQIKKEQWACIVTLPLVGILLESALTIHQGERFGEYTQNFVMLFDYVIAIAVFVAVKYLFECKGFLSKCYVWQKVICAIGPLTLGMYVMDPIWRCVIHVSYILEPFLLTVIVAGCWCLLSMCLSGVVTYVLKKLPGFRKFL